MFHIEDIKSRFWFGRYRSDTISYVLLAAAMFLLGQFVYVLQERFIFTGFSLLAFLCAYIRFDSAVTVAVQGELPEAREYLVVYRIAAISHLCFACIYTLLGVLALILLFTRGFDVVLVQYSLLLVIAVAHIFLGIRFFDSKEKIMARTVNYRW